MSRLTRADRGNSTYEIRGDDFGVEVEFHPEQPHAGPQSLRLAAQADGVRSSGDGLRSQDAAGRVQAQTNVILEQKLDEVSVWRLVAVVRHVGKGRVNRDEESVVGLGAVLYVR